MGRPSPETKQVLIDTARALIWMNSYGAVSVEDICQVAKVKKGSFYHFFPSKLDLALAAMDETFREIKPMFDDIFSPSRPPLERFERLVALIIEKQAETLERFGRVCGCSDTSLSCEMAGLEERVRVKYEEVAARKKRYYENALRDMVAEGLLPAGTDVKVKAEEIFAYLVGQMTVARIQNSLDALKRDLLPGLMGLLGVQEKARLA